MAEIDNTAEELFFKLRNRFPRISMGDENGQVTIDPKQGRFFNFDFEESSEKYGKVTCSLIDPTSLKIYFSQQITEQMDEGVAAKWFSFLRELRRFSKVNMLTFDVRDISKDALNQEDIEFASKQSKGKSAVNVSESKIQWERRGRFSEGNHKSIKIHVVHKNKMDENPNNRLIQVDKLYLVNEKMERFLLPFTSITGAKAMANHVARGGTPYDEGGLAIGKAVAEMKNLQRFATATRNKEFESANSHRVIDATRYIREELRKHLKRMAGGRFFEEGLNAIMTLTKADDHRTPEEIKDWFVQKYYSENIDSYLESAAHAYNKYEEHEMSTLKEAAASVAQKILDPNYKLILKADDAMDNMIRSGKYTNKMALVTRSLMDIADRLITKDGDDVANFAAMMSDKISSEGEAFGQRPDEEYKQQKALAIKLAAKYIGDMNKMQADPAYKDEVRKDPTATMGAKKDLYGKAKTAAEAFEDEIMSMGEEQLDELNINQIKKDIDSGMSADAVIGKHANKRMSNTDEIRKVIKQHAWDKRMKKTNEQGLEEEPNEGNEFSGALAKAKAAGAKTFKVGDKEYEVKEGMMTKQEYVDSMYDATDPSGYSDEDPDDIVAAARAQYGDKFADELEGIADSHWPDKNRSYGRDKLKDREWITKRTTKGGKLHGQDVKSLKSVMKTDPAGNFPTPALPESEMEAGECNHTAEGVMCPVHGVEECGYMEDTNEAAKPDFLDMDKDGDKEEAMKKALKDKEKKMHENELRRLAGLPMLEMDTEEAPVNEAQKVKFLGYKTTGYPLAKAIADKAYREGTLIKLTMDPTGKPVAIINDPSSAGEYEAHWNDQAGSWVIDFD